LQSQQFEVVSACGAADAIWSMPAGSPGTLTEGGIYFAPESISSQATVTITATTLGISSTAATATVTLMPPVSVSVTPPSTVLTSGQTEQLTANVANTSHTAVNWTISPAGVGSISATGLYSRAVWEHLRAADGDHHCYKSVVPDLVGIGYDYADAAGCGEREPCDGDTLRRSGRAVDPDGD
jgi:hypothetical protein